MCDCKFVEGLVNVVPQWPEFFGGPVTVYLWRFDINVLKAMSRQVEFFSNRSGAKCEMVAVTNIDCGPTVLLACSRAPNV
jgi:hypothetical protein